MVLEAQNGSPMINGGYGAEIIKGLIGHRHGPGLSVHRRARTPSVIYQVRPAGIETRAGSRPRKGGARYRRYSSGICETREGQLPTVISSCGHPHYARLPNIWDAWRILLSAGWLEDKRRWFCHLNLALPIWRRTGSGEALLSHLRPQPKAAAVTRKKSSAALRNLVFHSVGPSVIRARS